MPVNHYFQGGQGIGSQAEKTLHENLIIEGIKMYGLDVYYMPRTLVNHDLILGEDTTSKFDQAYNIEMYFETTEGFAGQRELVSKFGLEIREDTTFVVAKRTWQQMVIPRNQIVLGRPNEGDIIFLPLMNSFFEILFVEDQEPFFQLGNLPVYKLRVQRWQYSSEKLDTGVNVIDNNETKFSLDIMKYNVTLEGGDWMGGDGSMLLESTTTTGEPEFLMTEDYNPNTITANIQNVSPYSENLDLDTAAGFDPHSANQLLDFSETNPFGQPGEI
jgi:hypothetical protein